MSENIHLSFSFHTSVQHLPLIIKYYRLAPKFILNSLYYKRKYSDIQISAVNRCKLYLYVANDFHNVLHKNFKC